jgi:hypothetical protein
MGLVVVGNCMQILSRPERGQQVDARTIAQPTTNRKGKVEE